MKKLLGFLTSIVVAGSTATTVVACGGEDSTSITQGKINATTDFTLTDLVKVKNAGTDINQLILSTAISEGRLKDDINFNILDITDQKNNEEPTVNGQKKEGYLVLTFRDDPSIRYTGVITIRFTIVKEATFDISQEVNLDAEYFDVTEYQYYSGKGFDDFIWKKVVEKGLTNNAPTEKSAYNFSQLMFPPENRMAKASWVLEYNGGADQPGLSYSGKITVNFNWIRYQDNMAVELPAVNFTPDLLKQTVWDSVQSTMVGVENFKISEQYQNYEISWEEVKEPDFGGSTSFDILAKPRQENLSFLRIKGIIDKHAIEMPATFLGPLEIKVVRADQENIDKIIDQIWTGAVDLLKNENLPLLPDFSIFDTTNWSMIIKENWPQLGLSNDINLIGINKHNDPRFNGDLKITVKLINEGFYQPKITLDLVSISQADSQNQEKVLDDIWNILIQNNLWDDNVSTDRSKYVIDYTEIATAINRSKQSGKQEYYSSKITADAIDAGKDVQVTLDGYLQVIK
ncbi:hypothetical protein SSYRP_v1c02970 [Spiroplasma syrphidicola EA-1]|uniref:Lipoprotein n=1 Tax=Spiroplasma syrphidicola EA-1 TaxID=1276229 RepID=R4U5L5_9MOLU|nr:lipoprotein [Spiroplasma syrphidicola]AGM25893.1 hypothetical protein SSYRP_v1c02970 [Spiroplasma syrphidicola EA-1]